MLPILAWLLLGSANCKLQYYGPDYELNVRPSNMENANSPEYLEKIKNAVIENLKRTIPTPPSVQMQDVPRQGLGQSDEDEAEQDDEDEDQNKDARWTQRRLDKHTVRDDEFEESGDEEMAEASGAFRPKGGRKHITDHQNPYAQPDYDTPVANGHQAETTQAQAETDAENHDADETMEDVEAEIQELLEAEEARTETEPATEVPEVAVEADKDGDVDMTEATDVPVPEIKQEDADMQPTAAEAEPIAEPEGQDQGDNPRDDAAAAAAASDPPAEAAEVAEAPEVIEKEADAMAVTTEAVTEPPKPEDAEQAKPASPEESAAPAEKTPAAEGAEQAPKTDGAEPSTAVTSAEAAKED